MIELKIENLKAFIKNYFTVIDKNVYDKWHMFLPENCIVMSGGESIKNFDSVKILIGELVKKGFNKNDRIAAIGGGALLDLVGFVASIYMRGIEWVNVPTTLVSMVDSSIGGKTAINFSKEDGISFKNLVGSFHVPKKTFFCFKFLESLNQSEIKNGWGEIIKTALLDRNIFDLVNVFGKKNMIQTSVCEQLIDIIKACVRFKNEIIKKDLLDTEIRKFLNLGHTIGHGLESAYGFSHGVCIAKGIELEYKILGDIKKDIKNWIYDRTSILCEGVFEFGIDIERVLTAMMMDKKNEDGLLNFVVLKDIGAAEMIKITREEFQNRWKNIV
ncbi:MAG: 3-dehydroquinate synthase [Firmicutes bacterium]|nr:3-dehydroquinate synthase [Bacillota bacterium]